MKLEQFKEIADETLRDLTIDERMVTHIRQKACTVRLRPKSRVPKASAFIAAACAVVMLLSGGVLLKTMHGGSSVPPSASAAPGGNVNYALPENGAVSTLSSSLETSQFIDGTTLSYGIQEVGAFSGGYAPALATNGLYGYVNEDKVWVIRAMYDQAEGVLDGKAAVSVQGATQIIDVP